MKDCDDTEGDLDERSYTVIVELGQASLEEYGHGDPANRIELLRGSQSARKS